MAHPLDFQFLHGINLVLNKLSFLNQLIKPYFYYVLPISRKFREGQE